ncbi:MAG TPA: ATP-binding protein, partial [Gemmatimonadales bacterium]|nr:ATP-binding protein [Gemmatimonadales bacterium]
SVSHDLRTPLAAITGAATTLRDQGRGLSDAQRREMIGTVCDEAERLERQVANLLEMTRLESGELELRREWVPLEEIVGSALTRLESRLEGRPITTELPDDLPIISVDPVLLEQVFLNLLENAGKHTPPGTAIDVTAKASEGEVVVEVSDRGPGLPPGGERRLFERFTRGPHSAGAGLGLAICRAAVEAHGGTISAANRVGGGATFRITLPRTSNVPAVPHDPDGPDGPDGPDSVDAPESSAHAPTTVEKAS